MSNRKHILYIDDEADIRAIVEYALEDESDFKLELCASGKEAIAKVNTFKPDIILLDVMMPGMDGPTTLMKLRELEQTRATPVIFVTAKVQPHEVAQFKALGAIDVIAKPFDPMSLSPHIRTHLALQVTQPVPKKTSKIAALREVYQSELPSRIAAITTNWQTITAGTSDEDSCRELHRQVHSLVGSGSTFGYSQVSNLAREIESALAKIISHEQPLDEGLINTISRQLSELSKLAVSGPELDLHEYVPAEKTATQNMPRLVFLVVEDGTLLEHIRTHLHLVGWQVNVFHDAGSAQQALTQTQPAAIITNLKPTDGEVAGFNLVKRSGNQTQHHIPQIVISSMWNWESRLAAARAGVDAYLHLPLDLTLLTDQLEKLTTGETDEPLCVLIVEDTVSLAHYYAQVLDNAGMQTKVVTEPEKLLETLSSFHPDLILMDIYMPGCSGIEAARVIRQDNKFLSVPIVFLSSEAERQRQLGAMQTGADDFLVKPISDTDLIAAVTLRAKRFRSLTGVIRQDSLTGLLNHVSFKLQMEAEFARSKRADSKLSFALLDIDKFKSVNDNYGHPAGDRVLKALSQMLRTRLRKSDVIGRYGGEEFAILLPDTTQDQAVKVLNKLREQFALLRFVNDEVEFSCTFSVGLATTPAYRHMDELIEAADTALYEAKHRGRNQVCTALRTDTPNTQTRKA